MNAAVVESPPCAVCTRPSPLGLVVCPDCGGTTPPLADALLFVDPQDSNGGYTDLRDRLVDVLGPGVPQDWIGAAVRGEKALVRLPGGGADAVNAWLADQGIPTRTVVARRAWAALPFAFLATLAAGLVAGMLAGAIYSAWMLLATALFLCLLVKSAARSVAQPILGCDRIASVPALAGYDALLRATTELRRGAARDLAASLVRAARSVAGPDAEFPVAPALSVELDAVLATAAEAARDVAVLDETMESFANRENAAAVESWLAGRDQVQGARSRLESYLLEATGLVGRIQGLSAEAFDSAGERLRELTRELREASASAASSSVGAEASTP